jgi:hypothetical protein
MDRRARTSFHSSSAAVPRTLTSPPNDNAGRLQILDMNPRGHDEVEMKIVMDLAEYFPGRGTFSAALDGSLGMPEARQIQKERHRFYHER